MSVLIVALGVLLIIAGAVMWAAGHGHLLIGAGIAVVLVGCMWRRIARGP